MNDVFDGVKVRDRKLPLIDQQETGVQKIKEWIEGTGSNTYFWDSTCAVGKLKKSSLNSWYEKNKGCCGDATAFAFYMRLITALHISLHRGG
jgi:hypothetical protein